LSSTAAQPSVPTAPIIAADVGGTHARLALARFTPQGGITLVHYSEYICSEYPDLATILRKFNETLDGEHVSAAAIAIAGLQDGDQWINTNLPWRVSVSQTRSAANLDDFALINDFEALAHAAPHIDVTQAQLLNGQPVDPSKVTTLIVGPGTGFGQAVRMPWNGHSVVITSEAGHAALAPGNELEIDILRELFKRWPHVDRERAVSGPGLLNIYECICTLHGVNELLKTPAEITNAALANANPQAVTALNTFCALLGSLVGDLVLAYNARAVFLAGGIPSRIRSFLPTSQFAARYHNKGSLSGSIKDVPIWLIEHGQLGLVGAAAWHQEHRADS
jgi:glucokinase